MGGNGIFIANNSCHVVGKKPTILVRRMRRDSFECLTNSLGSHLELQHFLVCVQEIGIEARKPRGCRSTRVGWYEKSVRRGLTMMVMTRFRRKKFCGASGAFESVDLTRLGIFYDLLFCSFFFGPRKQAGFHSVELIVIAS